MSQQPTIIVPARLESSRLKRKLLYEVEGKPLIIWTADRIRLEVPEFPLFFAVDSKELADCLKTFSYDVIMTNKKHLSGTDRIAEANKSIRADVVINIQADEPLIHRSQIKLLASSIEAGHSMTTLASLFVNPDDFYNPNCVKVVVGKNRQALYFSRSPIPYVRDLKGTIATDWLQDNKCFKHIGIYAYQASFLKSVVSMNQGTLESFECLEQLRVLENGESIHVEISNEQSLGIDTLEDIEKFKLHLTS